MNKQINNEKTCTNCRHYSQHYSKQSTRYNTVFCGNCLHKNVRKFKKQPHESCEFWEDNFIIKEERRKTIKETLEMISKRLEEIAMILKDDSE